MLLVPYLQIRANSIYSFTINEDRTYHRSIQAALTANIQKYNEETGQYEKQETYKGKLTTGAKKRLIKAIDFLVMSTPERTIFNPVTYKNQPFKIGFVTLTVGSKYDPLIKGKEAYKNLLAPFIKWMRDVHGVKTYLWKAELQKRGQIHYHITIDQFIHWKQIRAKWNELQRKNQYIESYHSRFGHYDPNSVDIHAMRKQINMGEYLKKEIVKSFQNQESIGGKIWDCSLNLKVCKYFSINESMDYSFVNHMVKTNQMKVIETDHCYIYQFFNQPAASILNDRQLKEYNELMNNVRHGITVPKKEPEPEPAYKTQAITPVQFRKRPPDLFDKQIKIPSDVVINNELFGSS